MATHRVRRRDISRSDGTVFEPGDKIAPTDAELRAFGDNLVELDDTDNDDVDSRAQTLADGPYQEAVEAVRAGEADEFLDDLAAVDDRSTVQDVIDARRG